MNKRIIFIFILVFILFIIAGCNKETYYVFPENYYCEIELVVYTEKTENNYFLRLYHCNEKYKMEVVNDDKKWVITYDGLNYKISNNKTFKDIVLNEASILNSYFFELSLKKFNGIINKNETKIEFKNQLYKYILTLDNKKNPIIIEVYKGNKIIKKLKFIKFEEISEDDISF